MKDGREHRRQLFEKRVHELFTSYGGRYGEAASWNLQLRAIASVAFNAIMVCEERIAELEERSRDEDECEHMQGAEGSCARCEGT